MIIEFTKSVADKAAQIYPMAKRDGNRWECADVTEERMPELLQLARYLWEPKAKRYKVVMSEADIATIFSYAGKQDGVEKYVGGFFELPQADAVLRAQLTGYKAAFDKALEGVKIKRDNNTENMMYYTATADNEYLNVSGNILDRITPRELLEIMRKKLGGVFERFDRVHEQKVTPAKLLVLTLADPLLYLYLVGDFGKSLVELMDLAYSIPNVREYYENTGSIVFDCAGGQKQYLPGYGLVDVTPDVMGMEVMASSVF